MKLKKPTTRLTIAVGVVATLALVSCGSDGGAASSPQAVYDEYASMNGQERRDALVEAAQAEGELTVYSTNSALERMIAPAFEEEYGITVTVYRATTEELRQRVLQEASANRIQNDVVETNASEMALLAREADLIAPYESEIAERIPDEAKTPYMTGAYYIATLPISNRSQAPAEELPTSFEDYADPEWAGRLAIDQGDYNWYHNLYRHYTNERGYTDQEFIDMMEGIVANSRSVTGHVSNTELLSAGDFSVFLSDYLHYVPRDRSGPLTYTPIDPVTLQVLGAQPMREAEHPAAALLFVDYYLTEGQALLDEAGFIPANPDEIPDYEPRLPDDTVFVYDDWEELVNNGNAWQTAFENLLQGSGPVLPE